MNKNRKLIGIISSVAVLLVVGLMVTRGSEPGAAENESNGSVANSTEESLSVKSIYNEENQALIKDELNMQKDDQNWSLTDPLIVGNPFGTNTTGVYLYFQTEEAVKISYSIYSSVYSDATYSQTLNNSQEEYATTHEYQLIGTVPGEANQITLTATDEVGNQSTHTFTYDAPELQTTAETQLAMEVGTSTAQQSQGLYVILGNDSDDQDAMYYYDNDGIIRGEVPIIGYRSHRILADDQGNQYFSVSEHKIAQMDPLGQITRVYDLGIDSYALHHDYVMGEDGKLLILATNEEAEKEEKRIEDFVIELDLETGEITNSIDFKELFPDWYQQATGLTGDDEWDPLHLNTIQYLGDDSIIVSSRETSSIIKVSNISEAEPQIDYLIGDESFWEGTEEESLVLDKSGSFTSQLGQHTVTYETEDSLPENQYYLSMYNNNVAYMPSLSDYDWTGFPDAGTSDIASKAISSYYKYLVDEEAGTYELVSSMDVPYSPFVSSVQAVAENLVVNSGMQGIFSEYDEDQEVIKTFTMSLNKGFIYRVFKYDFNGIYFSE